MLRLNEDDAYDEDGEEGPDNVIEVDKFLRVNDDSLLAIETSLLSGITSYINITCQPAE
ncbi:hypothetical protein FPRO04_13047 [Fusarium proliferatum]|nr:hypothetical protein FPRO04_13047 [Fusarium proliferatum]